jgi:hypothetical protein
MIGQTNDRTASVVVRGHSFILNLRTERNQLAV